MIFYLPELIKDDTSIDVSQLGSGLNTRCISVTGQDGSGKTSLRDGLANYFSEQGKIVVTAKSPCDKYLVKLLNHAISQDGNNDWFTEQLLFSFADGLLSNYMMTLDSKIDYFICQRGPIDQYAHGITRSEKSYDELHEIQRPERLARFDVYIHMNCKADVAWDRVSDDEGKDRYEYPEYFARQVENTRKLYEDVKSNKYRELDFLRSSKHLYVDTTNMTIEQVLKWAISKL